MPPESVETLISAPLSRWIARRPTYHHRVSATPIDREAADLLARAARAYAERSYGMAADLYRAALDSFGSESADRTEIMLDLARSLDRAGNVSSAWTWCQRAADRARLVGDAAVLADAATTIRSAADRVTAAQIHELCVEALAALDASDKIRRDRVQAVLTSTVSQWARPVQPSTMDADDAESRFREMQAAHAQRLGVDFLHDRLDIADRAVSLGRRSGSAEVTAWGLAWRMDALAQLGDRIALEAELAVFDQVVERLHEPAWTAKSLRIRATLAFADGRLQQSRELSDQAVALSPDDSWTQFLHLVTAGHLAQWSGTGLDEVEPRVRASIEGAPFFARGWLALILVGMGRLEEAGVIWQAIAPHVTELPKGALESLIAQAGHARLCVAFGDREHAAAIYQELAPHQALLVCTMADSPCDGPVVLHLARLSLLLGDLDDAQAQADQALAMAHSSHALPFAADASLALAEIAAARRTLEASSSEVQVVREARRALEQADRIGLQPLSAQAQALLDSHRPRRAAGLTDREEQVVALLAGGMSNRAIAQKLQLSERTVENHVSHVLTKIGQTSRTGIAAWYAELGRR